MGGQRLSGEQQQIVATHLELIEVLDRQVREMRSRVVRTARDVPAAALLRTVPGIGPYWGILLAAELLPIERFPNSKKLISYAVPDAPDPQQWRSYEPRAYPPERESLGAERAGFGRGHARPGGMSLRP